MCPPSRIWLWVLVVSSGSAQPRGSPSHQAKGGAFGSAVGGGDEATPALRHTWATALLPSIWSGTGYGTWAGSNLQTDILSCPMPISISGRCPMPGNGAVPSATQLSWLGWWDGRGTRPCLASPHGDLRPILTPRDPPAPSTLWRHFSPARCSSRFSCTFHMLFDKGISDIFSKLNYWKGLPAYSDIVSKLSGCIWFCLFNYDVWSSDQFYPPDLLLISTTLPVLFHWC